MYTNTRLISAFRSACILLSSLVIAAGALSLIGWIFHLALDRVALPSADTALTMLLLGIALRASAAAHPTRTLNSETAFYSAAAILVGLAALTVNLVDYRAIATQSGAVFMSGYTAIEFILLGLATLLLQVKRAPLRTMAEVVAACAGAGALFACIAALDTSLPMPGSELYTAIPATTAVPVLILAMCVFLAQPQETLDGLLVSDLPGGKLIRAWVVPAVIVTAGIGLLLLLGETLNLYQQNLAVAALSVVILVLSLVALFFGCRQLDHADAGRRTLDADLRQRDVERKITLENIYEPAVYTNQNGEILDWNQQIQNLLGYTESEALGATFWELVVPPDGRELCRQLMQGYGVKSPTEQYGRLREMNLVHKDGHLVPVEVSISPIPLGHTVRFWLVARNISERQQMASELSRAHDQAMESSRLKSEFVANISHEIRTPLNAIIGMSEILVRRELPEELRDFISTIHESADALLSIVNDILDYSKIEAGKLAIEATEMDMVSLVEGAAELVAGRAREKGLSLASYIAPDVPAVLRGDPGRIRQVLLNLLTNAIKFTETGEVVLTAFVAQVDEQHAYVRFEVRDSGIGIPEEGLTRIFEPFTQADGSATRKHGGTGLGLSISKRLVELMRGQIGVESLRGEGSDFWFVIPLEKPIKRAIVAPTRKVFQDVKLLVVDGPTGAGEIVCKYASAWGIRCDTAETGEDAVAMMRREASAGMPYDLAIIDFQLTYSDALALGQSISRYGDLAHTKVILTSCFDDVRLAQDALRSGFSAVLSKPIRQARLYDCFINLITQPEATAEQEFSEAAADAAGKEAPLRVSEPSGTGEVILEVPLILVVEDNPVNQKVVMLQLSELGYRAHAVANGREALEALERMPYALILMDCQMPEMDGFAATREIRERETLTGQHVPIVALTAHAMIEDKYKCLDAGMDDYISKPVKPKALRDMLERYLSDKTACPLPGGNEPVAKTALPKAAKPPIDLNSLKETFGAESASELVSSFIGSTKFIIDRIAHGITSHNPADIEAAAHELVGSSASMTASELSNISCDLEKASIDKNWNAIDGNFRALRGAFERLSQFVNIL